MNTHVEIMESIGCLNLALLLCSAIGFERQWHQKMAGLRTTALVALGSCGFVVFSAMVGQGDPTRVAALTANVLITAQVLAAKRNDAALEQIIGRLSLEPHISAVAWQVDRTIPEA